MPDEAGTDNVHTSPETVQTEQKPEATAAPETGQDESQAGEVEKSDDPKTLTQADLDRVAKQTKARAERRQQRQIEELQRELGYLRGLNDAKQPANPTQSGDSTEPNREKYESYDDYIVARAEHRAKQAAVEAFRKEREAQSNATQQERLKTLADAFAKREDGARDRYDDYDDAISAIRPGSLPQHVVEFVGESELGPDILYKVANDPALAAKLQNMPMGAAARTLAKLETALEAEKQKPVSKTPEPVKPLGSRDATVNDAPSPKDSDAEWLRKREQQLRARR